MKSGLDCVQCVEVFPDSMNHCVPDWDGTVGKEMDILWEQTDLFSPSKGKWDSGHTRKSDLGFVPEIEFEELCWEDGQLFVVMQGLNSRGTAKNQIAYQTDDAAFPSVSPNSGMLDTPRVTELVDLPSVNMQTQEDDLFSWLQHPPEDLAERLEPPRDMVTTSLVPVSKSTRPNTPLCMGDTIGHGSTNRNSESSAKPALVLSTSQKEVPCEPCLDLTADVEVVSQSSARLGSMNKQCGTLLPNPSSTTMNFSNFSRPAVAIKANLQSLGIVNGLRVPERLKQLERVAGDKWKSDLTDSMATHSKVIAPRKEDAAVGASFIKGAQPNFPLPKKAKQIAPAGGIVKKPKLHSFEKRGAYQDISACNKSVLKGIQCDAWNSSFIDRANAGVDPVTDVLEIPEASELSSSGGSEDSDVVDGQRVSTGKRKNSEEDSEIQSEALENEVKDHAKQGTAVGNEFKKSRASENHNQSERRRRDRISEKMKTLQALLPNSYKTDKASMLEEAIAYIKALKSQIQMMSYKSGMCFPPVVLSPGVSHIPMAAWPLMNTGIGMNMGMGMHAGMGMHDMNMFMAATALRPFSLPMMTFPNTLVPAGQTNTLADLGTTPKTPGIAAHVLPPPPHQSMAPVRPGNPLYGKSDSTRVGSAAPSPNCPFPQQRHSLQT